MIKPWEVQTTAKEVLEGTIEKVPTVVEIKEKSLEPPMIEDSDDRYSVLQTVGGNRSDRFARLMSMEKQFRAKATVHERKAFVAEYIKDFSAIKSLRRLFLGKTESYYQQKAQKFMKCGYVTLLISMVLEEIKEDAIVTRKQVLIQLKKEMDNYSTDATSTSRIAAAKVVGKLLGMEVDRSISLSLNAQAPAPVDEKTRDAFLDKLSAKF